MKCETSEQVVKRGIYYMSMHILSVVNVLYQARGSVCCLSKTRLIHILVIHTSFIVVYIHMLWHLHGIKDTICRIKIIGVSLALYISLLLPRCLFVRLLTFVDGQCLAYVPCGLSYIIITLHAS
jgi:hypothetical protein